MSNRHFAVPLGGTPGSLVRQIAALVSQPDEPAPMFPLLVVEEVTSRPWTSATFEGELHRLELRLHGDFATVGDAIDRLVDRLPEAEFDLPGQIVAAAQLVGMTVDPDPGIAAVALVVEVLTVID